MVPPPEFVRRAHFENAAKRLDSESQFVLA